MNILKNITNSLLYDMMIKSISESKNITEDEAKKEISAMSFSEYHRLCEAGTSIVPPSGQTISPKTSSTPQKPAQATKSPQNIKAIWPGQGAPLEVGMTVGTQDQAGKPVPGEVSQIDKSANGVKIKNPLTGKDEWMNMDDLTPFANNVNGQEKQVSVNNDIQRLKELAGISENCSAGATGAGAIAIVPAQSGNIKRRQSTDETLRTEYTPAGPPKTIVGDTKPSQASGKLSSTLAANKKPTASRKNNGFRK